MPLINFSDPVETPAPHYDTKSDTIELRLDHRPDAPRVRFRTAKSTRKAQTFAKNVWVLLVGRALRCDELRRSRFSAFDAVQRTAVNQVGVDGKSAGSILRSGALPEEPNLLCA